MSVLTPVAQEQKKPSKRPPFEEVQRSRPDFNNIGYHATKTPAPDWKVGSGSNRQHRSPSDSKSDSRISAKEMIKADELGDADNYKMIV